MYGPDCGCGNYVTLKQVVDQPTIICVGCRELINFKDKGRSARRTINDTNNAFKELNSTLKKLGRL